MNRCTGGTTVTKTAHTQQIHTGFFSSLWLWKAIARQNDYFTIHYVRDHRQRDRKGCWRTNTPSVNKRSEFEFESLKIKTSHTHHAWLAKSVVSPSFKWGGEICRNGFLRGTKTVNWAIRSGAVVLESRGRFALELEDIYFWDLLI